MNDIPRALGLEPDQVEDVLTTASRAPSLHNSQPWRFRLDLGVIELQLAPDTRLPVIDPDGREQRIACGAALFNLRLALAGLGVRPIVTVLPDRARPELIAEIRHGGRKRPTPDQLGLLRAVPRRRTNRRPFSDEPVSPGELQLLRRAALEEGAWLHVVDEPRQRRDVRELAARAHRAQMADPAFREELHRWTGVGPDRLDGVPATAGGPLPPAGWLMRDFAGNGASLHRAFEDEPLIAVLSSHLSGQAAEIGVGQALERVLLAATAEGLAVSFLSQVVEVPGTREQLRRLVRGMQPPQAVLRIGRGWPVPATPRLPVDELLLDREPVGARRTG